MLEKIKNGIKIIMRKGSLISLSLMIMIVPAAALAASSLEMAGITKPDQMTPDAAKKGIVRIIAGTEDSEGNFEKKSVASGFIVSNTDTEVRIVTTLHSVDYGENGVVKVAVKNDLAVEASVEKFPERDFCILTTENKFNDKEMIPIRVTDFDDESSKISLGEGITVLGFPVSVGDSSDYTEADVSVQSGKITKTAAENEGYIEHDAIVTDGCDGGVMTDSNGYVIGLVSSNDTKAMDIREVDTALYKEGENYRSKDKDEMYSELYDLCDEAENQYKKADKETKNEISRVYGDAMGVLENGPYDRDALRSALDDYKGVVGNVKRSKKPLIFIIGLGALIAYLSVRLILLVKWNKQHGTGVAPVKTEAPDPNLKAATSLKKYKEKNDKDRTDSKKRSKKDSSANLVILRTGATYNIHSRKTTLGRSNITDITIPDNNRIGRDHAWVENRKGVFYLYDNGSTNGTYLNNNSVGQEGIRLVSGDIIRLADEEIEFVME